jgi:hypothetical protein
MLRTASPFFRFGGGSLLVPLQLSGNQKIPEAFVYKASGMRQ